MQAEAEEMQRKAEEQQKKMEEQMKKQEAEEAAAAAKAKEGAKPAEGATPAGGTEAPKRRRQAGRRGAAPVPQRAQRMTRALRQGQEEEEEVNGVGPNFLGTARRDSVVSRSAPATDHIAEPEPPRRQTAAPASNCRRTG